MIQQLFLVASGGALGSVARFLVGRALPIGTTGSFPIATLVVNLLGSLLIGMLFGWIGRQDSGTENMRLLLMTGFCGGFTTFSALTLESLQLIREQKTGLFFLYISISLLLGLAATFAGWRLLK